ncbi:MAG: hypothetical protein JO051_17210 [Acidobacteriaceae bacterium]|nr:hypothetical protein [Acidobacteriaceae bacterium]
MKDLRYLTDGNVLRSYEFIRDQVLADAKIDRRYRLMGLKAQERASALLDELRQRGLVVSPIEWPDQDGEK